jgi:4-amino-4-deoxy-L-arabinose transferase-like glycosyltransferase
VALYALGRRVHDHRVGLTAAAIFAVYPPAIHFSVQKIWDASLLALAVVGLTLLFLDLRERPTTRRAALLGLLLGVTTLLEPTVLVLLPAGFVWLGVRIGSGRRAGRLAAVTSLVVALAIAPWLVRNAVTFDRFVFVKSNLGHELLIGNLPIVRPGTHVEDASVKGVPDEHLTADEVAFVERVDEGTRTRYYLAKSLAWIREHPGAFAVRTIGRVARMWTLTRGRGVGAALVAAAFAALALTALASLIRPRGRRPDALLPWLFAVLLPIGNYLTVATHWRYRFPSEALLAVPAALTLTDVWRRLRRRGGADEGTTR